MKVRKMSKEEEKVLLFNLGDLFYYHVPITGEHEKNSKYIKELKYLGWKPPVKDKDYCNWGAYVVVERRDEENA